MKTLSLRYRIGQLFRPTTYDPVVVTGKQVEKIVETTLRADSLEATVVGLRVTIEQLKAELSEGRTEIQVKDAQITIHEQTIKALTGVIERDRLRVQAEAAAYAVSVAKSEAGRTTGGK